MAPKKSTRAKARKTVTRSKATRKSSVRSPRKAPAYKPGVLNPGEGGAIGIF